MSAAKLLCGRPFLGVFFEVVVTLELQEQDLLAL
jgi:hypothetical protein